MKTYEGFYFFQPINANKENLYVRGKATCELQNAIIKSKVSKIFVLEWHDSDLNFFLEFKKQIKSFVVEDDTIKDIAAISDLDRLKSLSACSNINQIDFSKLKNLEICSLRTKFLNQSINFCKNLKVLSLTGVKIKNLYSIFNLSNVSSLSISEGYVDSLDGIQGLTSLNNFFLSIVRLNSLDGIQALPHLNHLLIADMRILSRLNALMNTRSIVKLEIESCRSINDIEEVLNSMSSIEILHLINMGSIKSLQFLNSMKNLKELDFSEHTTILDGDLGVLLKLPNIEKVSFDNKKHYSHTSEQIGRLLKTSK